MLKVYRIDRSIFGKINNKFKKPDLPLATASIGNPFKNYKDFKREGFYVLSDKTEIDRFVEAFGGSWQDDQYYIRHPKETRTNVLVPASKFHKYIIREMIGDIIYYLRAHLNVKELDLSIKSIKTGSLSVKGVVEGLLLDGKTTLDLSSDYTVKIKCSAPLKPSEKKTEYIWINEFPHLISLVDEAKNGIFSISESFDLSFGFDLKMAETIGASLDLSGNTQFNFVVTVD
ncbi:hypothetical protein MO387_20745 [Shewanella sp. N2AIL]|uniref:hypothetical protein n=1 Tax=Shewanella sp. N2AIL TaxID=2926851 RepID=UPI001F569DE2|nr:hypothetical protein [Shewanella sp. N2AIL]MCI2965477.1 hypothetical protein [Shewanella sp. N2AIL]